MAIQKLPAKPSEQPSAPRAWGYVRVSTDQQADSGLSIDEQKVKIEARCLENGWRLERIFVDAGVSGGISLGLRPEGKKLLGVVRPSMSSSRRKWIGCSAAPPMLCM